LIEEFVGLLTSLIFDPDAFITEPRHQLHFRLFVMDVLQEFTKSVTSFGFLQNRTLMVIPAASAPLWRN
jgi:hypothetical protein